MSGMPCICLDHDQQHKKQNREEKVKASCTIRERDRERRLITNEKHEEITTTSQSNGRDDKDNLEHLIKNQNNLMTKMNQLKVTKMRQMM